LSNLIAHIDQLEPSPFFNAMIQFRATIAKGSFGPEQTLLQRTDGSDFINSLKDVGQIEAR
jgi:hypothetical protein